MYSFVVGCYSFVGVDGGVDDVAVDVLLSMLMYFNVDGDDVVVVAVVVVLNNLERSPCQRGVSRGR
jgi:hypothetical protein